MKTNIAITLIIFLTAYLASSQEVIYTIQGEKSGQVTHLDSLLFENLENQTQLWIKYLPIQTSYEVNLAKQGLVPVLQVDFTEQSFRLVRNIPGEAEIMIVGGYMQNVNLRVYNLNGQVMYSKQISEVYPGEAIHLRVPGTGVYILNLHHKNGSKNFKVIGSSRQTQLAFDIGSSTGDLNTNKTQSIESTLKSRFYYNGFSYQPGDSLRITAFLGGHFTYPQGTRIAESESFGFIMLKSTADSTGISDRYKPIPNDLINILNYDTLAGTTTLVITTDTINFNFGDIITLDLDTTGIIQRIVRITKEDDEVILETETAYMDELFVNQSFKLNTVLMEPKTHLKSDASPLEIMKALTDDDGFIRPVKIIYHDEQGKRFEKSVLSGSMDKEHRENIVSFYEDLSQTDLYGKKGDNVHFYIDEGFAKLHADAVFEFDFTYEGELTEDTKVKRGDLNFFEFYLDAESGFKTKLALDMKKSLEEEDTERIYRMKRATAKFMVPPGVPVWITFSCDIYSFYNLKADASLHADWGFESNHTLQAGGKYERATNEFTPIYNYTPHNEIYPLNIEGEVNASARVEIYPRVDVRLYGFFGPFAEIAPYVQGQLQCKAAKSDNFIRT
jgi:hypothetical protein